MARVIIHIGTHKTGTTTIQDTFAANRARLAQDGIIYPDLGPHSGHHGLLLDWVKLPLAYALPEGGVGTLRRLADQYATTSDTLLLSSEEFSRGQAGNRPDLAQIQEIFAKFEEVQFLCVLREPWQFLQSVYLEIARNRCPPTPTEVESSAYQTGMVDGLWCDYAALYDHLETTIPASALHFIDYGQACAGPGGLVGAVLHSIGSSILAHDLIAPKNGRSNISSSPLPIWAALMVANQAPIPPHLLASIQDAFNLEFGPKPSCIFTRLQLEKLRSHFEQKNYLLLQRLRQTQPFFRLSTMQPPPDTVFRDDIEAAFWLRCARRIYFDRPRLDQLS